MSCGKTSAMATIFRGQYTPQYYCCVNLWGYPGQLNLSAIASHHCALWYISETNCVATLPTQQTTSCEYRFEEGQRFAPLHLAGSFSNHAEEVSMLFNNVLNEKLWDNLSNIFSQYKTHHQIEPKYTLVNWNIMWVNCKSIAECVEEGSTRPKGKFSQCTLVLTTLNISRLLQG